MRKIYLLLLAAMALQLSACGGLGPKLPEREAEKTTLIYGYIDMAEAPAYLNWVQYKQYRPATSKPYFYMRITGASEEAGYVFYREVPAEGSYQLVSFGGNPNSFFSSADQYIFNFPAGRNSTAVKAKKSGLYFMGAYKYVKVKTGFFEQGKFDLKQVNKSRKEILEKILPHAKDTRWEAAIMAEMKRVR